MRKEIILVILGIMVLVSGCAARYGNEKQYTKGDWYFFAGSSEVARIQQNKLALEQNKLALEKLEVQPVQTVQITKTGKRYINVESPSRKSTLAESRCDKRIVNAGYKGKVANFSRFRRVNFIITGPEQRGKLLSPGDQEYDYLIPGVYVAKAYIKNRQVSESWIFKVGVQQHQFMGEGLHWYVYYED